MPSINLIHKASLTPMSVLNPEEFSTDDYVHDPDQNVIINVRREYWKVSGSQLVEMTQGEKDVVDAVLIPAAKLWRMVGVDAKTSELITSGFTYDSNTFSLSMAAQQNWSRVKIWQLSGTISYPLVVSTSDNGSYSIVDSTSMDAFFTALNDAINSRIAAGRVLKAEIQALTTLAAIESWVDPR